MMRGNQKIDSVRLPHANDKIPDTIENRMISERNQTAIANSMTPVKPTAHTLFDYLQSRRIVKDEESQKAVADRKESTNTRVSGGNYHIPDNEYFGTFLPLYIKDVILKNKADHLTEKQLWDNGPCLVDVDLRYALDVTAKQYTVDHVDDLVGLYLEEMKKMYQFDGDTSFSCYVMEKDYVNPIQEKNLTKDGIHMIIGVQMTRQAQILLRKAILPQLADMWNGLPILNTWEDVLDEGITNGKTVWQMYGSCKPNHEAYKLTRVYNVTFDPSDSEFILKTVNVKTNPVAIHELMPKLSARYANHPSYFYTSTFMKMLQETQGISSPETSRPMARPIATHATRSISEYAMIRNAEELNATRQDWLDQLPSEEYELREIHDYTMALPESYYGSGSYNKWIRVCWALRNTVLRDITHSGKNLSRSVDGLLIVWLAFSAQAPGFDYTSIPDLCDKWEKSRADEGHGLTHRSIMHWCREDAKEKYAEIRENSIDYFVDLTISSYEDSEFDKKTNRSCGEYDLAMVLYQLFKSDYICPSVDGTMWYKFEEPLWRKNESGTSLRKSISEDLRKIYHLKASKLMLERSNLNEAENTDKIAMISKRVTKLLEICNRLGRTQEKNNIMREAKDLFRDAKFNQKIDSNPYLLCFKNGVIDFKEKVFRRGHPEDYLTKCTNIDYISIHPTRHGKIMDEIELFMHQLFPIPELHQYMWDHLSSTLIGTSANQTFNMYIGVGSNGKSMLTSLMELILGDYKGDVPLALITDRRTKIGGLAPEIVNLKGVRYAVIHEPSKGDRINEGVMKQLTSGIDPIQARAPYMPEPVTFLPQFKLVVCTNEFMEIKSVDNGTWRRIRVVDFVSLFTATPVEGDEEKPYQFSVDLHLKERFKDWKEIFMSMLVNRAFITNGVVEDCDRVLAASNNYRERQDYMAEFIGDRIVMDPRGTISKMELSAEFDLWYKSIHGHHGRPSIKDVQSYMDKKFKKSSDRKGWIGGRMNYDTAISNDRDEEEEDEPAIESAEL
jgi:P4 family phage/plasmid primase-like protien